jgi:hypothetical protein
MLLPTGTVVSAGAGTPNPPPVRIVLPSVVCWLRPVDVPAFAPA